MNPFNEPLKEQAYIKALRCVLHVEYSVCPKWLYIIANENPAETAINILIDKLRELNDKLASKSAMDVISWAAAKFLGYPKKTKSQWE